MGDKASAVTKRPLKGDGTGHVGAKCPRYPVCVHVEILPCHMSRRHFGSLKPIFGRVFSGSIIHCRCTILYT